MVDVQYKVVVHLQLLIGKQLVPDEPHQGVRAKSGPHGRRMPGYMVINGLFVRQHCSSLYMMIKDGSLRQFARFLVKDPLFSITRKRERFIDDIAEHLMHVQIYILLVAHHVPPFMLLIGKPPEGFPCILDGFVLPVLFDTSHLAIGV